MVTVARTGSFLNCMTGSNFDKGEKKYYRKGTENEEGEEE